jgi:hypothetical protein
VIALLAAAAAPALAWEGRAEVYPPGRVIEIVVRTRINGSGEVVGESWPVTVGEVKGMHRMTLTGAAGTVEIGGKTEAMPAAAFAEERAQFGFYRQLQEASVQSRSVAAAGANAFSVDGLVRTWFKVAPDGTIVEAFNDLPSGGGGRVRQRFTFNGWWQDGGAVFPRTMRMTRDGKPYFTLQVDRFDAE